MRAISAGVGLAGSGKDTGFCMKFRKAECNLSHLARTQRFRKRGPIVCWRKILEELDPVATETQAAAVHRLGRCAAAAGFFFLSNA